jgi:hypothetical protein
MQYECMMSCNMLDLYVPREKKSSPNIDGICIVGGKVALIPIVIYSGITYANVVSVQAEEHNRYIRHTSPLIPQVALIRLTLHGQHYIHYENILTSCKSDHKIFLDLHTLGVQS